ncbi:MAG: LPS export ABC transporter periplasmic protein LptC [candidate division Zixibacteria bacterium]|nr:LPS export ABC transporter periplasmic protein LptC [candidate division Zixibacteria bacterium]
MKTVIILLIATMAFLACTEPEPPQQNVADENYPDSRLDDATIVFTKDGKQNITIEAEHIDRWVREDSTEADTIKVLFFDDQGGQKSTLTANRGLIREKSEKVAMFGNVVAINEDSTVLKTESLFWDPETGLITTDDYVEIEKTDGDLLTGYGLKADRNLQELEILSDVAGKVTDVAEQEKEKFKDK